MFNYVILTTHSSHHYSMWDFTHTYNPTISPSPVSVYLSPPPPPPFALPCLALPYGLFSSLTFHPWASHTLSMGTLCQTRTHIHVHGTFTPHHYLAP